MPQMAPMNWLILYIFFSMIFMLFNFMNYYMYLIKSDEISINKMIKKTFNWKW